MSVAHQHNGLFVDFADLAIGILHPSESVIERLAFERGFVGFIDDRVSMLLRGQGVIAQGAIGVTLQFGNVS